MRTQCKNVIKPYSSRAYCLFYACVGNDLYATAIEHVELHIQCMYM